MVENRVITCVFGFVVTANIDRYEYLTLIDLYEVHSGFV